MKNNYYHQLGKLGGYNISTRQVMLDFRHLIEDEKLPSFTLIHESVHAVLGAETEFGHVTNLLYQIQNDLKYEKEYKDKILSKVYWSQNFVQEGFATLIPFSLIKKDIGKEEVDKWAEENITNTQKTPYKNYLEKLYFISDLDLDKRNKFYDKISSLAMENGFRKLTPKEDLLNWDKLNVFLSKPEHNPDNRLEKIIEMVRADNSILDLPIPKIANKTSIQYLPADISEIAKFMTYLLSKTNNPIEYKEEYVNTKPPERTTTLNEAFESMVIANMNHDFENTAEILFSPSDFLFMSKYMEVIVVHKINDQTTDLAFLKSQQQENPEVGIIGFIPNGEKYITYVSSETAENLINTELKEITLVVRFENYDTKTFKVNWSTNLKQPDIVLYSFPKQMKAIMKKAVSLNTGINFQHLHSQFMDNNPLQTLFVSIGDYNTLHIVNHYGNKGISEILSIIKPKSKVMDRVFIENRRKTINNLLSFWMGQRWEVDWVSNMFDKTHLYFRNGVILSVAKLT